MGGPRMSEAALRRYHRAARMIEADGAGAYHTCRGEFGDDVAGSLLVLLLRMKLGGGAYPPPADLADRVNAVLRDEGLTAGGD